MSNSLDRNVAVVVSATVSATASQEILTALLKEFGASFEFFTPENIAVIESTKFDALVLGSEDITHERKSDTVIRKFHRESKPIGAIGLGRLLVAKVFGRGGLEIALDEIGTGSANNHGRLVTDLRKTGALLTPCPVNDYISDRDHKTLTTSGHDVEGVRKMLRELVEMA